MAKQAKKLTRALRIFVESELGLSAKEWGYTKNTSDNLYLVNLKNGTERIVIKSEYDYNW